MSVVQLFFTFLLIGAVSFGGGYGMIPLIRETVLGNGWLTENAFVSLIAVSESTPGPLAVNMATYIGSKVGGFAEALAATLGVVLPSFCIITAIAALSGRLARYPLIGNTANAFLSGVRPCVVGMILSTAVGMFLTTFFSFGGVGDRIVPEYRALLVFVLLAGVDAACRRIGKRTPSPIVLICLSALLGIFVF
mgnify:FL=1